MLSKTVLEGSSEVQITKIPVLGDLEHKVRPRASRLEYKRVNKVYVLLILFVNYANSNILQIGQESF